MRQLAWSFLVVSSVAFGLQQQSAPADSELEREKDVYAIYSLMLTDPETSHGPDNNARYVIERKTALVGFPARFCFRVPDSRKAGFDEVLADYERRKRTAMELKRAFSVRKPYTLIADDQAKVFRAARSSPLALFDEYQGVTDLFTLSEVYFDERGTLALAAISSWCGILCGRTQWRVFERVGTVWEERNWMRCVSVS